MPTTTLRSLLPVGMVAALLLVGAAPATALLGEVLPEETYVVGFDPAEEADALAELARLGLEPKRVDSVLGFAVVRTTDPLGLTKAVGGVLGFAEPDVSAAATGAQWNGAQWNGAQWNAAQWNGAQWNGAQWNGNTVDAPLDPGLSLQWGHLATRTQEAWKAEAGSGGATLCVVDSGLDPEHADLRDNVGRTSDGRWGTNFVDKSSEATDDGGHGTHLAGIAAAVHTNSFGIAGVSNSDILAAKVLDSSGKGRTSDVASGIRWCADAGADVVLLALGIQSKALPKHLDRAIGYADDRDVVLVASAGNGGSCDGCVAYPAKDPRVLAVAAAAPEGIAAPFSSSGPEVDLAAPGVEILGTLPGDAYAYGSGTSQAAAYAAGAALLLREKDGGMSSEAVRHRLVDTASDAGTPGRDDDTGAGMLDVKAAVGG